MQALSKAKIKFFAALEHKKYRAEARMFLTEGIKMLSEGLQAGWQPGAVLVKKGMAPLPLPDESVVFQVEDKDFERLTDQANPEGIIAAWKMPEAPHCLEGDSKDLLLPSTAILLDNLRDPGNVGTVLRIADWFGVERVICNAETADFFNPRVLRAGMGAIFRVGTARLNDFEAFVSAHSGQITGAAMQGNTLGNDPLRKWILLGNEAHGISESLLNANGIQWVTIPGAGKAESLNVAVAAGIMAWEAFGKIKN